MTNCRRENNSNWDVNSACVTHTVSELSLPYTTKMIFVFCLFLSVSPTSVEQMCLLEKYQKKNFYTEGHLGRTRQCRRAYWRLLALNRWPFRFYVVSKSTGPTWQPWMFLGCAGLPGDIQPVPQRCLLGSQLCVLQGPTVSGGPQAGGDNN